MLTGDNGILSRAGDAKKKTEEEQIIEEAQMDILSTQSSKLADALSEVELEGILSPKYGTLSTEEERTIDKKLTTTDGKYVIPVSKIYNGELKVSLPTQVPEEVIPQIKDKDSNIIVAEQISNHYGDKVIYNNQEYQLFYVDTQGKFGEAGRIYLQSTTYIDEVKPETYNDATGLTDTSSLIYKLNPDWARLIGDTLKTDTSGKYKGVAYLCNTANWTDTYVSATDKTRGAWAIGAAPVEMFCASYNAKIQPESEFSAKAYTEENGSVGYRYKPTLVNQYTTEEGYGNWTDGTNYPLSTGANNMYNTDSRKSTWLASPYVAAYFWISIVGESSSALGGAQSHWRRQRCTTNSFSTI